MYTIILFVGLIIVVGTIIFATQDACVPKEDKNKAFIIIVAFLGIILILTGTTLSFLGLPARLNQLKKGRAYQYQVVAMYEKYIVVKPLFKQGLMFINCDNISQDIVIGGVYIKTSNKKFEKRERTMD